jgi:hypothetical protein
LSIAFLFLSPFGGDLQWKETFRINGALEGAEFGTTVCILGDVNGDDVSDLAVAAPRAGAPFLNVHSGVDGSQIWTVDGVLFEDEFGKSLVPAGDVNGDGFPDLLAAYPTDWGATDSHFNRAWVLSGRDGTKLLEILGSQTLRDGFASDVAPAGDLDGDAVPDLWIGVEFGVQPERLGQVTAFSGKSGEPIRHLDSREDDLFGRRILATDDIDSDGVSDLAVCSHTQLSLVSGGKAQVLWKVNIEPAGWAAASLGRLDDLDGDGASDVIVCGSRVTIVSGRDGRVLHQWEKGRSWNNAVAGLPDLDGDGHPEIAVGGQGDRVKGAPENRGAVEVRAAKSGEVLKTIYGSRIGGLFASALAAGDLNGDGSPELVVGEPGPGNQRFGVVHVFTLKRQ